ncbi:DUF5007 domain-containing protein [Pedobacter heparinus]|uniref:DUF5007 domain-containing protein n=1 Tax=Pedobacter heparinus TaxID=984 RepID=UPI00292D273E|nr:DUF5007 domain-containing protein [Pedobacter heparinus]
MYRFDTNSVKKLLLLPLMAIALFACKKNLPDDRLSLGSDSRFTQTIYQPILGRTTVFSGNFNIASSSVPLDFKLVNMRRFNGEDAPELRDFFPVKVWKTAYDGTETSLSAIEAKRTIENHQLFEIRPHSGQFVMWHPAKSDFVKVQPDSGYVFDVEVSNSGGRRYFQDFKLMPYREIPVEPYSTDIVSGQTLSTTVGASVSNIRGKRTSRLLNSNDVRVLFNKKPAGAAGNTGHSLSFKFVDTLFNTIDPAKFANTQWENVVHGFDMVKTNEQVTYQVAYPIPLSAYPTKYTNLAGTKATPIFRFNRLGAGNSLEQALVSIPFNIYQEGDWEIIFWFTTEQPKFEND